ncbi:glutamine--fructose-6-phosphate transaminase (isomerizing) [[Ruminococcus] lactaris]|uniref:glutamine--fructose-6-phosphate transaminase (isomerizing) n=1 Tax=[Ruminococcus] lactaris TaxID=46228 RepID=UPI001D03D2CB|nr:glutamine--fructose-6-phosphate transaminase (isomerizing) [[Ruminococcus] lactaris]MCB5812962.1 glutamine--fructose-6-phosphate transaminase (isomerizing) [[Ruminococcus] lactaris]MCB5820260.1 glutamine--fructose-6-phosphate transaminase (isomerizing) [[Ruminococcus] lactaris]MCB5834386.1 glutamine--fructose-6-phosphate transaminase (isomerizing) [[Ruminococcus] lactaris]MCB5849295.1 glutamine--fructose-6-phosphate transaminase (isomerizing) [[Ruminococcus] lactaris]
MCGIVGYVGTEQAAPVLLAGLSKLEYRGYDSAGIAIRNEDTGDIAVVKAKGRLKILSEKTNGGHAVAGTCGIGHTRWATHGEPSENNAHPHCTDDKSVVLVHNGIIENYQELKDKLIKSGYTFYSQTDTEIAVKLVDYYYRKTGTPLEAISRAMLRIRGSYAFGIMFHDYPGKMYAARKDSPLIIGKSQTGCLIASDVPAILDKTRNVYYIGNHEIAELSQDEIHFYNIDREEIQKEQVEIKWDAESAEKGGYEHFMLKEIHEQPRAVRDTIGAYVKDGKIDLSETGLTDEKLQEIERIYIVACGSAYHVGMVGKYVIEELADIPVEVDLASEFRYRNPKLVKNSLVVIVSQSGETADSLAALRLAKERKIPVLGIVNVVGSSIARESDYILYTYAGPEISVATTKAYSTQLIAMYLLAIQAAKVNCVIPDECYEALIEEMGTLPEKIQKTLDDKERIQWFASKYANAKDVFFIGRGIDYAISMEGSLKMKEISYIHSEAYAAGELKHGTISLIEDGILVVGVATQADLFEKTISNMVEVKSRGAYLMGLTTYGNYNIEDTADFAVYVPQTESFFATSLAIVPLQLMGYYVSVAKGLDVDKPRNLAKSVTVE